MASGVDLEPGIREADDVVQVNLNVRVRVDVEAPYPDAAFGARQQVVVQDGQPVHVSERGDGHTCAAVRRSGGVRDAVVMHHRHIGVVEVDAPPVQVEGVVRDLDVRVGPCRVGAAEADARILVALEVVGIDEHVGDGPAHVLVRIDAAPGGSAGLVVVSDQIVLDERRREHTIGEADADDVVLDDVVDDVRARNTWVQPDAVAGERRHCALLYRESVNDHVARADAHPLRVLQDRFAGDASPRIDARLRAA